MTNTEKKWYLLLVEDLKKDEVTVTIKKSQLISGNAVKAIVKYADCI